MLHRSIHDYSKMSGSRFNTAAVPGEGGMLEMCP